MANRGQQSERQHFVPAFYLRNFARKSASGKIDQIYVYDLDQEKSWRTAVENAGSERDFYVTTNAEGKRVSIEDNLAELEKVMAPAFRSFLNTPPAFTITAQELYDRFAHLVPGIREIAPPELTISTAFDGITPRERELMALFVATMHTRGSSLRRDLRRVNNLVVTQAQRLQTLEPHILSEHIQNLKKSDNDIAHEANQAILATAPALMRLFLSFGWLIARTTPEFPLVTSDTPFVRWSGTGDISWAAENLEMWLPLNPITAVGFYRLDNSVQPLPIAHLHDLTPRDVRFINALQVDQCDRFVYSLDDSGTQSLECWREMLEDFPASMRQGNMRQSSDS